MENENDEFIAAMRHGMEKSDRKRIASAAREVANYMDPFGALRAAALWFAIGAITVAAMNYGDVWICVGQCGNLDE